MPPLSLKAMLREARARKGTAPTPISPAPAANSEPVTSDSLPSTLIPDLSSYLSLSLSSATSALAVSHPSLSPSPPSPLPAFLELSAPHARAQYARGIVSELEEAAIIALMQAAPEAKWTRLSARALQVWGGTVTGDGLEQEKLPQWLEDVIDRLHCAGLTFPDQQRPSDQTPTVPTGWSEASLPPAGRANHVLFNRYKPGEGIMPHGDGPSYAPQAAILSLGAPILLCFWETLADSKKGAEAAVASLWLEPRSVCVFSEDLYWKCLHGIEEVTTDTIYPHCANAEMAGVSVGDNVPRVAPRMSLTVRRITPVFVKDNDNTTV